MFINVKYCFSYFVKAKYQTGNATDPNLRYKVYQHIAEFIITWDNKEIKCYTLFIKSNRYLNLLGPLDEVVIYCQKNKVRNLSKIL